MRIVSCLFFLSCIAIPATAQDVPTETSKTPRAPVEKLKKEKYVIFPVVVKSPEYRWGGGVAGTYFFKIGKDSVARTSSFKAVTFFTLDRKSTRLNSSHR